MVQKYKEEKLLKLKECFDTNTSYIFTNYKGLNVEKMTLLRRQLRKSNVKFLVIKNNFAKKILKDKNIENLGDNLIGSTAVAFINEDVNEPLKVLFGFEKDSTLKIKGGFVVDSMYNIKQLLDLSKLPGKLQLIAMLMATMKAPVQNFAFACNDVIGRMVRVLNAVAQSKK